MKYGYPYLDPNPEGSTTQGGDSPPKTPTLLEGDALATHQVRAKVNGEDRVVSVQEALARAQKDWAADTTLEEARTLLKGNTDALKIQAAVNAARSGDFDKMAEVGQALGLPEDKVKEILARYKTPEGTTVEIPHPVTIPPELSEMAEVLKASGLSAREVMSGLLDTLRGQSTTRISTDIGNTLDKDPELSYLTKDQGRRSALMDTVQKAAQRRYFESGGKLQWGPALLQEAITEVKGVLKLVGSTVSGHQGLVSGVGPGMATPPLSGHRDKPVDPRKINFGEPRDKVAENFERLVQQNLEG